MSMNYVERGEQKPSRTYFSREENDKCVLLIHEWKQYRLKELEDFVKTDKTSVAPFKKPVPEFVAVSILKICTKIASRYNYNGYVFKEDMIQEAVYNMIRYLHTFDTSLIGDRSKRVNFYGWVTSCADRSFGTKITSEELQEYCKNASFVYSGNFTDIQNEHSENPLESFSSDIQNDYIERTNNYEIKKNKQRKKQREKSKKNNPPKDNQSGQVVLF